MEANKLYKVEPLNYRGNTQRKCGLLLKGNTINITIYGSKTRPENLSEMVDLTNADPFISEGSYVLSMLPPFVYFDGTADIVELIGYINTAEYPFGVDLPMSATDLTDMGYSSETIDARLNYLATLGLVDTVIYLYGNGLPTSASEDAQNTLSSDGCYILTD